MAKAKFWAEQIAEKVAERVRQSKGENATIVCASGVSPSGPIHLGNLREVMTVHIVAEELLARGWKVDHLHSWDDFDRLRKTPLNVPEQFAEHIGKPISDVPDPFGEYESYAVRYMTEFERCADYLGIRPRYVRQSQLYRSGTYTEQIKLAMAKRFEIFDILAEFQKLERHGKSVEERRQEYYPFRVYCASCGKDDTYITQYEPATATIVYTCKHCGVEDSFSLNEKVQGKLVWKVDWPMRWKYEGVDFEPAGADHSAPGSSFSVGQKIARQVFDYEPPYFVGYAFVGMAGRSKLSSSIGTNVTPRAALDILEPCILRWLYVRRNPSQSFDVNFGQEVVRLYDEWDAFSKRVTAGNANEAEQGIYKLCVQTSIDEVPCNRLRVPFRLLSSVADITQGNIDQILRIVSSDLGEEAAVKNLRAQLEPRLSCAIEWATNYLPEDERTHVRETFDDEVYAQLSEEDKRGIQLLLEHLDETQSVQGLTKLLYGIPKLLKGLPMDTPPNDELKQAQRSFFVSLYSLLCNNDTGPRLPTFFLSIGADRVRKLLTPTDATAKTHGP